MKKIIFSLFLIMSVLFYADITTGKDENLKFLQKKEKIDNFQMKKDDFEKIKETNGVENSKNKLKNDISTSKTRNKKNIKKIGKYNEDKKLEKRKKLEEIEIKKKSDKFKKAMLDYRIEAVIKTNKGLMSFYLYPEAAPVNVANFVYLVKRNFYNGLKFHRVLSGILVQGGDPHGDGFGSTGYTVKDEVVDWLNFEETGLLAMANSGPDTNSSQFFVTLTSLPQLNEKYTIIGEIITREDLSLARVLREGDTIIDIEIKGKNIDTFLNYFKDEVKVWDKILK